MTVLLWLVFLLPAAVGAGLAGGGISRVGVLERWAAPAAVLSAAGSAMVAVVLAAVRPRTAVAFLPGLPFGIGVDGLSAVMTVTVAGVSLLVLGYAAADLGRDRHQARGRFFGFMLLFTAGMQLTVTATTTVALLIGWELMGATSYALIGFWWPAPRRAESATVAFLTTRAGDLGLYVAAGALLAGGGGGWLAGMAEVSAGWRQVLAAGLIVAAAGKSAQLPFSFWLSRAMDGPSPVSALLHSATMAAAGGYLVLRAAPLLHATSWAGPAVSWLGAVTAVGMGLVALAQIDLKQLLAASTCAQVGFIFLAAGSGAVSGGALQLVAHAATKALLFCVAGAWLTALGSKQLRTLRGAARRWRGAGILFTVGSLGLAGVPPLAVWVAKEAALAQAARHDLWLYAAGLVGAVLSAAYSARALSIVWQPATLDTAAGYDQEQPGTRRMERGVLAPVAVLGVFAVALVALGLPPLTDRFRRAIEPDPATLSVTGLTLSATLAAGTVAFVWWWVVRARRLPVALPGAVITLARSWWGLETAARRGIGAPVLAVAAALARFDDHILDGAVDAAARGVSGLARAAARFGEAGVEDAVAAVADGARRLGMLARRPQTGQLHQYYAQAAAVLAAFIVLLLIVR